MYNREGPKEKKRDTAPERMTWERSKRANQNPILVTVMRLRGRRVGHIAPSFPPRISTNSMSGRTLSFFC